MMEINQNEEYGINLQPAIWKTDYLMSILSDITENRSAWGFEAYLLGKCNSSPEPIQGCYSTSQNILNIHNGILQGKWFRKEIKYFNERGIAIVAGNRGILSRWSYIKYVLKRKVRENLPSRLRKIIKKILMKIGFSFVTNV